MAMREWATRGDVKEAANLFMANFTELRKTLRILVKKLGSLPPSCSLEVQHMCMHMAAVSLPNISNDLAEKHYFAAIGHSRRALLDAYKEFLFSCKSENYLSLVQQKQLAQCRVQEVRESFHDGFREVAARYKQLFEDILGISSDRVRLVTSENCNFTPGYWPVVRAWLELDSLLSSLNPQGVKNTSFLQKLLESLFFDDKDLGMSPKQYLAQSLEPQKLELFKQVLLNPQILDDFNTFLQQKGRGSKVGDACRKLKILIGTKNQNLEAFMQVNAAIFSSLADYFQLKYCDIIRSSGRH